jgi:hypothetical protein
VAVRSKRAASLHNSLKYNFFVKTGKIVVELDELEYQWPSSSSQARFWRLARDIYTALIAEQEQTPAPAPVRN